MDVMAFLDKSLFKKGRREDSDKNEDEGCGWKRERERMTQSWLRVRVGWEKASNVDQDEGGSGVESLF